MREPNSAHTGNWGGFYLIKFFHHFMFISPLHRLCSGTCWKLRPFWRWHGSISISKYRPVCSTDLSFSSPYSPPTAANSNNVCTNPSDTFFLDQNYTWSVWGRSPSDMLCFVLPVPSHPNAVIGILASSPQIRHNTDVSFSFTPHSQTLPYKYNKENSRITTAARYKSK